MLEDGYIKLHRSLLTWEWYKNQNTKDVFLHLLLTANHYDEKFEGTVIHRGQRVWSRQSLAKELGISEQSIRTAINHLISTNELTSLSTPKYSIITINNYEKYQTSTSSLTNDQPAINQPSTSDQPQSKKARKQESKNIKEIDKEKPEIPYEISEAWGAYSDMRLKIKKPMTDRAVSMALGKLDELAPNDFEMQRKILNQSVFNSWQGLFALKGESNANNGRAASGHTAGDTKPKYGTVL